MDDAARVCVREPGGDLARVLPGQRASFERPAGHELHHDAREPVDLRDVVGLDEIRVVQLRRDARLTQEARTEFRVARQVLGEHLQSDRALELLVPAGVDDGHPAATDLRFDAVGAQSPPPPLP